MQEVYHRLINEEEQEEQEVEEVVSKRLHNLLVLYYIGHSLINVILTVNMVTLLTIVFGGVEYTTRGMSFVYIANVVYLTVLWVKGIVIYTEYHEAKGFFGVSVVAVLNLMCVLVCWFEAAKYTWITGVFLMFNNIWLMLMLAIYTYCFYQLTPRIISLSMGRRYRIAWMVMFCIFMAVEFTSISITIFNIMVYGAMIK